MSLQDLIFEASRLGDSNLCIESHNWVSCGGRACPHGAAFCFQPVYRCERCGDYDYGEKYGPVYMECSKNCKNGYKEYFN